MGIVKQVAWFSTMKGTMGIAVTENSVGEEKGRIFQVGGEDRLGDIESIGMYGAEFPLTEAKSICKKHGNDCYVPYE